MANPIWRIMGLPNFRVKLPSRNWTIFLTITGSWTAAVVYDRRQTKHIQHKWAKFVEHVASQSIDEHQLNRKLTIYISAPPADGLVSSRDHFNEYVKPILVAAALDWDAVEGRREGDVRAGIAERIRKLRRIQGEGEGESDFLGDMRKRSGVREWDGIGGDIVIGRHTWKEYVRGLHEGWLGPANEAKLQSRTHEANDASKITLDDPTAKEDVKVEDVKVEDVKVEDVKVEDVKVKKVKVKPFNSTPDYPTSTLSPNCPTALGPTAVIPLPHLLGFFNFPIRMYRFLNRRNMADDVGRETAAAVIAAFRPFDSDKEQQRLLAHEETDWHKTVRERKEDTGEERVWLDEMVLDARISSRMRRFELDSDSEEKALRFAAEGGEPWWRWQNVWSKKEQKKNLWEGLQDEQDKD